MPLVYLAIGTLLGFLLGYLRSYTTKKGENRAMREDIHELTSITKQIEARISNEVWDRQKKWELKREAVYSAMAALGLADEAVSQLTTALRVQKSDDQPQRFDKIITEMWETSYERLEDLERKRALALIVCGAQFTDTLMLLKRGLRDVASALGGGKLDSYEAFAMTLKPNYAKAFSAAREELGIAGSLTPRSSGSSGTQDPGSQAP